MDRHSLPLQTGGDGKSRANDAACHAAGKTVDAWTLNPDHPDAADSLARLVALRADRITTDAPGVLEMMFGATRRP